MVTYIVDLSLRECTFDSASPTGPVDYAQCLQHFDGNALLKTVGFAEVDVAANAGALMGMCAATLLLALFLFEVQAGRISLPRWRRRDGTAALAMKDPSLVAAIASHVAQRSAAGEDVSELDELARHLCAATAADVSPRSPVRMRSHLGRVGEGMEENELAKSSSDLRLRLAKKIHSKKETKMSERARASAKRRSSLRKSRLSEAGLLGGSSDDEDDMWEDSE